jgi:hypothetical protein
MPTRALYYPEWTISSPEFLVESLLFWDRLAVLVPRDGFFGGIWHPDAEMKRLLSTLHEEHVTPIVPSEEQKKHVHERLSLIFEKDAPQYLRPENLGPSSNVTLAADKFSPDTVNMLAGQRWLRRGAPIGNIVTYEVSQAAANVVMAALANECGSSDMPPITRDAGGFVATCNSLLGELGAPRGLALGERVESATQDPIEGDVAFLLEPISHVGIRDPITAPDLRRVIIARNDPDIEGRRKEFVAKVEAYLSKIRAAKGGERDVIRDEFGRGSSSHKLNSSASFLASVSARSFPKRGSARSLSASSPAAWLRRSVSRSG